MSLDDFFLSLQRGVDRAIRRLRLGPAPRPGHRLRSCARSDEGALCWWRGKCYLLSREQPGPFDGRADLDLVLQGIRDLMAMPSAGDLVIYGIDAPEGNVSFVPEVGAHAGPSMDELHTFFVHPAGVGVPDPITHPLELYSHFIRYQDVA